MFLFVCFLNCVTIQSHVWLSLQEFAGEDNSDLFLEEREQQIVKAQEEKRRVQMSVPGIIGPHDMPEEMLE